MTKEPSKDFRQLLEEQVFQLAGAASLCWEPKPDGVFDSTQAKKFADEAADNLLAICKEMLVQEKSKIRDLVLDDVPHKYQQRLLEVLK